ncbi:MAG: CBS domain-containing protein [Gammaproteobacteria bacterium]|nr:CBS domain-containing protein [Gammaproteobacteria bacterium]NNJ90904.1 CBS domain-containing protein [Gammaproteobacteria bacterium]
MSQKKLVQVKDVMKKRVDIVDGMSTVQQALEQMEHIDTKCLIVDKRDEYDEYGIVMIADIAKHVLAKDRAADRVNIYEIMSKPVIHIDADMDIRYCARLFDQFGLSRAPVMQDNKLVGIISFHDMVLRSMVNQD